MHPAGVHPSGSLQSQIASEFTHPGDSEPVKFDSRKIGTSAVHLAVAVRTGGRVLEQGARDPCCARQ